MKHRVLKKQQNSKMCFLCGLKNPYGLKAAFYELENNELVCIFKPSIEHQSYPGRLHGGIAATVPGNTCACRSAEFPISIRWNKNGA